jgi:hypothetical protein
VSTVVLEKSAGVSGGTLASAATMFVAEEPERVREWLSSQEVLLTGPAHW